MSPPESPLVDVGWLADHLGDGDVRVADVRWYLGEPERGLAAYREGHIPGAVYVHLEKDLSAADGPGRHPLPSPEAFAARMGTLGIGDGHRVVAYDDRGGAVAARLWWMLRALGHPWVAVLDGGLAAWRSAALPLDDAPTAWPPARLPVAAGWNLTVNRDELRRRLGTVLLIDARDPVRYWGDEEPIDPIAGHIPTSVNAPYVENLDHDDRMLPPSALADRFRRLGVDGHQEVVVYCGSGVTACHDLLALEVAGMGGAALYPGSWSDWATAGYPVAVGDEPGPPPA